MNIDEYDEYLLYSCMYIRMIIRSITSTTYCKQGGLRKFEVQVHPRHKPSPSRWMLPMTTGSRAGLSLRWINLKKEAPIKETIGNPNCLWVL